MEHEGIWDFGLRNREPARRVGVRRTIANLENYGEGSKNFGRASCSAKTFLWVHSNLSSS
jgi:hypothetical protein